MPYEQIILAVRDLGFPIVVALALLWITYRTLNEVTRQLTEQTIQLKAQTVLAETQSSMLDDILTQVRQQNSSLAKAVNNSAAAIDLATKRLA